jgi:tetratricopeptide (TPR) repeat protein
MSHRLPWFTLLIAVAGCQSLPSVAFPEDPEVEPSAGRLLWEQGQDAMRRGQPDKAIACYEQCLAVDPGMAQAHLSLAATFLEVSNDAAACPHLGTYLEARPEEILLRAHYAELLYRLQKSREAREQFTRFMTDAQEQGESASSSLIHCHSRLMEIAEKEDDPYGEHLNRGIGLLLLARSRTPVQDPDSAEDAEGLLCKAAGELTLASMEQPEEARPCWYLYEVWSQLAQRQPAERWLRKADLTAPFSSMTPAEMRDLQLALSSRAAETLHK